MIQGFSNVKVKNTLIPPILPRYTKNVRVASEGTDIPQLAKDVIMNKIDHRQYDPAKGDAPYRKYLQGLVFQDSELSPYRRYIENEQICDQIANNINLAKKHKLLPYHLGANEADFMKAEWLNYELKRPPFLEK